MIIRKLISLRQRKSESEAWLQNLHFYDWLKKDFPSIQIARRLSRSSNWQKKKNVRSDIKESLRIKKTE